MFTLEIHKRTEGESIPWKLLLLADPSRDNVEKYLENGDIYLAFLEDILVGEFVLAQKENMVELKNLAVNEKYQSKGIGKQLIMDAIAKAKMKNVERIEVGTGNSSLSQLSLYKKCGFRIIGIDKDFFTRNYKEKIIENGIECRDMVRLAITFV